MPSNRLISGLVAASLVCLGAATLAQKAPGAKSVWSGVYTKAQAARGQTLYASHCAQCHGDNLAGKFISDSSAPPPLRGERFTTNWVELTLHDLHTRVRTTMPPDTPGSLKNEEYLDILTFLLEQNGYPEGSEPMPSADEALKAIAIQKAK